MVRDGWSCALAFALAMGAACNSFDEPSRDDGAFAIPGSSDIGGFAGSATFPAPAPVPLPTPLPSPSPSPSPSPAPAPLPGVDAGLIPGIGDSDGDGCPDAAEELLGGCDGEGDLVLVLRCDEPDWSVTMVVPAVDGGSPEEVILSAPGSGVAFTRERGDASAEAGAPDDGRAHFRASFVGDPSASELVVTSLLLTDGEGRLLREGVLMVVWEGPCTNLGPR